MFFTSSEKSRNFDVLLSELSNPEKKRLEKLARKYVWWKKPQQTFNYPERFIARVMEANIHSDVLFLKKLVGETTFKRVLSDPPVGIFSSESWENWHLKLNKTPVPPLPKRNIPV